MSQVQASFTALGNGGFFLVQPGQILNYEVSGTFSGTVVLERTRDGGLSFEPTGVVLTAPGSASIEHEGGDRNATYRWACTVFGSGTIVTTLEAEDVATNIIEGETRIKGQIFSPEIILTDQANILWDVNLGQNAVLTLNGDRTLNKPSNMRNGAEYKLRLIQGASGGPHTLAYAAGIVFEGSSAPVLSVTAGQSDLLVGYSDGDNFRCTLTKDYP